MRADHFPRVIAPDADVLIDAREAARRLGLSVKTIRRWERVGLLHAFRFGNPNPASKRPRYAVRFRAGDVARLSASRERRSP